MSISEKEIKHIANLARLDLTENEEKEFSLQLGSILAYVEKLNEVETKNIEITAQVSGLTNVLRDDKVCKWDENEIEMALGQGDLENRQVKVKRIL